MNDFLQTVLAERRRDALDAARSLPLEDLQRQVSAITMHYSLKHLLRRAWQMNRAVSIIAEVKKASPAAGVLCADYQPAAIARQYEQAGAVAVSVLTEPHYFQGDNDHLRQVRQAVKLPVLRKDFICDPYQVYEAAALGADAILLIAAALDFHQLRQLYIVALSIGLEVIIEAHTGDEMEMTFPLAEAIIGINNRNIKTLKTSLAIARELAPFIPPERLAIAESGIKTRRDIEELQNLGYKGFLIGEALMRSFNPGALLKTMLNPPARPVIR